MSDAAATSPAAPATGAAAATGSPKPSRRSLLRLLAPFLRPYRGVLTVGAVLITASALGEAILPRFIGQVVDLLRGQHYTPEGVRFYTWLIVGIAVVAGIARFYMRITVIGTSRRIEFDMRGTLFDKLQALSPSFYDRERTGDIMERATGDIEAVRMFLGPGLMWSVNTLIFLPIAFWMLGSISVALTLVSLLPFAVLALGVKYFGQHLYQRSKVVQDHLSALSAMVQENLAGIRVVQAFGQEEAQTKAFAEMNRENVEKALSLARAYSAWMPFMMFMSSMGFLAVLWMGGYMVIAADPQLLGLALPRLSLGDLTTFTLLLLLLTWPTIALGWTVNLYQRASASMHRIQKILDITPKIVERPGAVDRRDIEARLEVRDLTFRYPNPPSIVVDEAKEEKLGVKGNGHRKPGGGDDEREPDPDELPVVLRDIDLVVEPGQTLGIVGPIGSGKSTLARLLGRLYPVEDGHIFLGGVDVNALSLDALRRQVGYVFQETFLFSASIGDNIRYGRADATDEEVAAACKIAALHDDVAVHPKAYETMLGERGINLSGGQKQRAAIARALIYNPKVLILDDALSAVDAETEERILHGLREANRDRTVVIIAHRVSTLRDADRIIVLDRGRIAESGTHAELLAEGGFYATLHRRQQLEQEIEAAV